MRIAKVDIDVGRHRAAGMIGQFLTAIPGAGFGELTRQPLGLFDERRDDAFGVFVRDLGQHHKPGMALDQRGDVAVLRSADQLGILSAGR